MSAIGKRLIGGHVLEIWKPVIDYKSLYEVSSLGNIRVLTSGKSERWRNRKYPMKLLPVAWKGYLHISLSRDGKARQRRIGRLVLAAFREPCPAGCECAHLNGDRANNCLYNLAWVTPKENARHRILHGTSNRGERHGLSILTEKQVHEIRRLYRQEVQVQRYGVISDIARLFRVDRTTIQKIIDGKSWAWLKEVNL
jgi:hypothetical protein